MNNSLKKQLGRYFAVILAAIILGGSIVVYGIYDIYRLNKEQKFLMESSVTTLKSATGHLEWIDKTDQEAAYSIYVEEMVPTVDSIVESLSIMSQEYEGMISKEAIDPVLDVTNAISELEKGNLSIDISSDRDNEFGYMINSLSRAVKNIGSYVKDIDSIMSQMEQGNFDETVQFMDRGTQEMATFHPQWTR